MTQALHVWASDALMGTLTRDRGGRLAFAYDEDWRTRDGAYPLSLSMPLARTDHANAAIAPFLWGLLPDNEAVLRGWAREFQVSAANVFGLLQHVGQDVSGALQFLGPDETPTATRRTKWLKPSDIAERLARLRANPSMTRLASDSGQFSLAGAQAKTALFFDGERWGVPAGRMPTTHILKPPLPDYPGHIENEHACLRLAQTLNLTAADSFIGRFGDQQALVVRRFDRTEIQGRWFRIHQEDMCQSMGLPPDKKYQRDGGPSPENILLTIQIHSDEPVIDAWRFVDYLIYNWLIGGTDAHAKNYGFLITEGPSVRLAPLYDVASILCYPTVQLQRAKLAMRLGGEYRLALIGLRNWLRFADAAKLKPNQLVERIGDIASSTPAAIRTVRDQIAAENGESLLLNRLVETLTQRSAHALRMIESENAEI